MRRKLPPPTAGGLQAQIAEKLALPSSEQKTGWIISGHESMTGMGYVSRIYDKLPDWVKLILGICAIAGIVYGVAREGWVFLLKVIFSP